VNARLDLVTARPHKEGKVLSSAHSQISGVEEEGSQYPMERPS
jgi:hypothetical protein